MIRPCVAGHSSEPLSTTVLPQASGVAMARTARMTGAFQGAMPSTTPAGWRTAMARLPGTSEGMIWPLIWVVSDAASRNMLAARCTLKPAQMPEAPVSAAMAAAKASVLASSACDAFISIWRRSVGPSAAQAGKACCAASTARTASCGVAAGARVATDPSSGLRRSKVAPLPAWTAWPAMSMVCSIMTVSLVCGCGLGVGAAGRAGHRRSRRWRRQPAGRTKRMTDRARAPGFTLDLAVRGESHGARRVCTFP